MIGINRIMQNAKNANWALTDDFQFRFINANRPLNATESDLTAGDILDISVVNLDIPQLGSSVKTILQGGEYRIYNAIFEPFTVNVTFRDFGGMELRNYFSEVWMASQRGYFNDIKSTITISMGGNIIFHSDDCLINSVSQIQLNNASTQIAEFSVDFSSPYYTNALTDKFGKNTYEGSSQSGKINAITKQVSNIVGGSILDTVKSVASTIGSW